MDYFIKKGHARPSAYTKENWPQKGIMVIEGWIGPEDLEDFAAWVLKAHQWCKLGLGETTTAEASIKDNSKQKPAGNKKPSARRSKN